MKVVDLFCGCGGLSLGFEKAGMDVVAGFDNWQDALDVYRRNFTHPATTSIPAFSKPRLNPPQPQNKSTTFIFSYSNNSGWLTR